MGVGDLEKPGGLANSPKRKPRKKTEAPPSTPCPEPTEPQPRCTECGALIASDFPGGSWGYGAYQSQDDPNRCEDCWLVAQPPNPGPYPSAVETGLVCKWCRGSYPTEALSTYDGRRTCPRCLEGLRSEAIEARQARGKVAP